MAESFITRSSIRTPKGASVRPYGRLHVTDFLDVWPHYGSAFGIDHLIYSDGEVELRIQGKTLDEL